MGADYFQTCEGFGIFATTNGYGIVYVLDAEGARWTLITRPPEQVDIALKLWELGVPCDPTPPGKLVVRCLEEWPLPAVEVISGPIIW